MVFVVWAALVVILGLCLTLIYLTLSAEKTAIIVKSLISQAHPDAYINEAKEQLQTQVGLIASFRLYLVRAVFVAIPVIILQIINVHTLRVAEGDIIFGQHTLGGRYYISEPGIRIIGLSDHNVWPAIVAVTVEHTLPNSAKVTVMATVELPLGLEEGLELTARISNIDDLNNKILSPALRGASLSLVGLTEFDILEMPEVFEDRITYILEDDLSTYNIKVLSVNLVQYDRSVGFHYRYTR